MSHSIIPVRILLAEEVSRDKAVFERALAEIEEEVQFRIRDAVSSSQGFVCGDIPRSALESLRSIPTVIRVDEGRCCPDLA